MKYGVNRKVLLITAGIVWMAAGNSITIEQKRKEKNCPFSFFDVKGWIVMVFMITFGITIRSFHLLPDAFISVFYTGLSLALMSTGVLFIRYWWVSRKSNLFTPPPEE